MKNLFLPFVLIIGASLFSCRQNAYKFDASGTIEATELVVSAQTGGEIKELDVEEGDVLQMNQTVGFIDTVQLYLQKCLLQRGKIVAESKKPNMDKQLAALEVSLQKAIKEKKRIAKLIEGDAATEKNLDDINAQIHQLQAQISAQKSTINNTINSINAEKSIQDIQIAQVEDMLAKSYIKSPITGVVIDKYAQKGEMVAQGRPLFKIANLKNVNLRAFVTYEQLSSIKLGQKVSVLTSRNDTTRTYTGKINWISDKAEFTPKNIQTPDERTNLVYAIKINIRNDGYLKIGMYADVKF